VFSTFTPQKAILVVIGQIALKEMTLQNLRREGTIGLKKQPVTKYFITLA
jgi:hypothetical protein